MIGQDNCFFYEEEIQFSIIQGLLRLLYFLRVELELALMSNLRINRTNNMVLMFRVVIIILLTMRICLKTQP